MKLKNYKIKNGQYKSATYIGVSFVILNLIVNKYVDYVDYMNPLAFLNENAKTSAIIDILFFTLVLSASFYAFYIARKLYRNSIIWAILTFCFTPISLIILGLLDINMDDRLKPIFKNHRTKYFADVSKIKIKHKNDNIKNPDYQRAIELCEQEHQERLNNAIQAKMKEIESFEEAHNKDKLNLEVERCSQCGTFLMPEDTICPNCKLQVSTTANNM